MKYKYLDLKEVPQLKEELASWFSDKWGVPTDAYLECMDAYLEDKCPYGWYLCKDIDKIVGGLGVIENDFHSRKDLKPNVCAVYVLEEYRNKGIAGKLLNLVVCDMKNKGISPLYLLTDHIGFYEKYGWRFLCMAKNDYEDNESRIYIHD